MRLLTTTLLLTTLTMATFADAPSHLAHKKAKIVAKITKHLTNMEKRKACMAQATSLNTMQMCRMVKHQNRPFKLKEGMSFETKRAKIVNRIAKRIERVKQRKSCVENALTMRELKACRPHRKHRK